MSSFDIGRRVNGGQIRKARTEALRQQLQRSLEKSAAAVFSPPTIGMERVPLTIPRAQQEEAARTIIDAATKAGGSATKGLPNESGFSVLIIVPESGEAAFRETLTSLGAAPPRSAAATPAPSPNDVLRLEIVLSSPH